MSDVPIIVDDHGDLSLFSSVRSAELYLEAIDVENQEYRAYDASGRVLELGVRYRGGVGHVFMLPTNDIRPDELRGKLITFLSAVRPHSDCRTLSLRELVEQLQAFMTE